MMKLAVVLALLLAASPAGAQDRVRIGILPFDVANVDGGSASAAESLAKLVRAQMITNRQVTPVLLQKPEGAELPLSQEQLRELAAAQNVTMIVAGTVLEAETTRGNNRISTGSLGGALGGSIGGSMSRTRAHVVMHVEIAGVDGNVNHTFQAEGNNTDVGLGTDIWTSLGSFDVGDNGWDKSPMGKALREAAEKVTAEVLKRAR